MTQKPPFILLAFAMLFAVGAFSAEPVLNPVPQRVEWKNRSIEKPAAFRVATSNRDVSVTEQISLLLPNNKNGFPVLIAVATDKTAKKYRPFVPAQAESYYLSVAEKGIAVVGKDVRGLYYGLQTLRQLLSGNRLPLVEITDYPDIASRGVVEGFYGTPWSFDDRMRQLAFYGENKLNTYIYGPKDDPYHSSPHWRKPYPESEAQQLQQLVQQANRHQVDFVWAIHPGKDIKWNETDRDSLMAKFEMMYDLGVRSFALFFDDISGEGTNPRQQAGLLNYLDNHFVKKKPDVKPLIMCPTEYNRSWSNPEGRYLETLGETLHPDICVMWTGNRVISDMSREGLEWINSRIRRKTYVWWNFPVSDYVRDHLLLGPVYGNETGIKNLMSGFMTNPMERAEASKIAIYGVADYAWNLQQYNPERAWTNAIGALLPDASEALRFFAAHNSDLGPNGHGYRRDESVAFKPVADAFWHELKNGTATPEKTIHVQNEFAKMIQCADALKKSQSNVTLTNEITPWIEQFKLLGQTGQTTMEMRKAWADKDKAGFLKSYQLAREFQTAMYELDRSANQNPYQPGVKTASLVIAPLIDSTFTLLAEQFNRQYGDTLSVQSNHNPHALYTNIEQLKRQPLRLQNRTLSVSPLLEVVKMAPHAYAGVELEKPTQLKEIKINTGQPHLSENLAVEISSDGKLWVKTDGKNNRQGEWSARPYRANVKFVRLVNLSDSKTEEVYLRKFEVVIL